MYIVDWYGYATKGCNKPCMMFSFSVKSIHSRQRSNIMHDLFIPLCSIFTPIRNLCTFSRNKKVAIGNKPDPFGMGTYKF